MNSDKTNHGFLLAELIRRDFIKKYNELKTVEKSSIVYDFFDLTNRITLGDIGSEKYTIRYFTELYTVG